MLQQLKRSRDRLREFDFYGSFTVKDRFAVNINMLLYNRDDEQQVKRIRALFDALIADARQAGYGEYRTHLDWMDRVATSYDFNDNALLRLNEKVKDALDPNGILAPGKQGVWPSVACRLPAQATWRRSCFSRPLRSIFCWRRPSFVRRHNTSSTELAHS